MKPLLGAVLLFAGLAWGLTCPTAARAQDSKRQSLQGVGAVRVVVEDMRPDAERDGLTQSQMQTDVELRLRREGVPVASDDQKNISAPFLYVRVNTVKADDGIYSYSIDVAFHRLVSLDCTPSGRVFATTWNTGVIGQTTAPNLRNVRRHVGDYVDRFINDYLAVNPPQRKD